MSLLSRIGWRRKADMKWCCFGFKAGYESAGQRGVGILLGRNSSGSPMILMEFRAVDVEQKADFNTSYPVTLSTEIRLIFCPWCGKNAVKWYAEYVDELTREALEIKY
jgi:hypothetical protein